jgi:hypothetical protein
MHLHLGLGVGWDVSVHAIQYTHSVRVPGHVGEQFADGNAAFTVLLEFERGTQQSTVAVATLPIKPRKLWLVIKCINVGRRAFHKQENDPLRRGLVMGGSRGEGICTIQETLAKGQLRKAEHSKSAGKATQHVSTGVQIGLHSIGAQFHDKSP